MMALPQSLNYFGASVRGPAHTRSGLPNQDAWAIRCSNLAFSGVVADGLGSATMGHVGAHAACTAGLATSSLIARLKIPPGVKTVATLRAIWHQIVESHGTDQCESTCLFAHLDPTFNLFLSQVGDGLLAIRRRDGRVISLEREVSVFQNVTQTISTVGANAWLTSHSLTLDEGDILFMATDGIADDIETHRLGEFIHYLANTYFGMDPKRRVSEVRRALIGWPTPQHIDDKTFVLVGRKLCSQH